LQKVNELFASKNRTVAGEYVRYLRAWAECFNALMPGLIPLDKWTTEICKFPGGDVFIMSSDPNAFRGMEGDVTLDEFALHDQQDALFAAAQSRIQWLRDGQVTLISSHSHPETTFNRLVQEWNKKNDGLHSVHQVTIHDAVKDGLARKVWSHRTKQFSTLDALDKSFVREVRSTCLSDEDFAREYECRPAALSELIFPEVYDTLSFENVGDFLDPQKPITYGPNETPCDLFVGIDCGRAKDSTVCWIIARYPDPLVGYWIYRTVCVLVMERTNFVEQCKRIAVMLEHPQMAGGLVDQGAQGRALADVLWERFGYIAKPIGMSSKNKGEMAELVRAYAQSERITFPKDGKTKQSVCCVRRVPTPGGSLKYEGSTSFDHADRFWALALALYAAEGERKTGLLLPDQSQAATAPAA
jgi:phage FluMu gp28-like protein